MDQLLKVNHQGFTEVKIKVTATFQNLRILQALSDSRISTPTNAIFCERLKNSTTTET